jgi:hypothetical protein
MTGGPPAGVHPQVGATAPSRSCTSIPFLIADDAEVRNVGSDPFTFGAPPGAQTDPKHRTGVDCSRRVSPDEDRGTAPSEPSKSSMIDAALNPASAASTNLNPEFKKRAQKRSC